MWRTYKSNRLGYRFLSNCKTDWWWSEFPKTQHFSFVYWLMKGMKDKRHIIMSYRHKNSFIFKKVESFVQPTKVTWLLWYIIARTNRNFCFLRFTLRLMIAKKDIKTLENFPFPLSSIPNVFLQIIKTSKVQVPFRLYIVWPRRTRSKGETYKLVNYCLYQGYFSSLLYEHINAKTTKPLH